MRGVLDRLRRIDRTGSARPHGPEDRPPSAAILSRSQRCLVVALYRMMLSDVRLILGMADVAGSLPLVRTRSPATASPRPTHVSRPG